MASKDKNLGFFFTLGVSVKNWHETGLLDREIKIYEILLQDVFFDQIFWFTYGPEDVRYQHLLRNGIIIVPKPKIFKGIIGDYAYSLLLPILQKKFLKQCNIFKTNQMWGSWSAVFSKWLFKKPLFVRTGYTASKFFKYQNKRISYLLSLLVEKLAYQSSNASIVTSESDKQYVQERYKVSNVTVIPNYVDTDVFKNLNLSKNKDLIFIGRLNKQKNLFNLIRAVKGTNYQLDIYGSGDLKKQLVEFAKNNNIKVTLNNPVPNSDLPKLINQYKIFILCSYYEGMPKTLLEAMACGLACLGTDVIGINEVISHKKNGWLVNTDPISIINGIDHLMNSEELRNKLSDQARQTIEKNFSITKILQQEESIYGTIIQ